MCIENDISSCNKCGTCIKRCPFDAITFVEGVITTNVNKCLGCGVCVSTCETKIRKMARQPREDIHKFTVDEIKNNPENAMIVNDKGKYPTPKK